MDPLGQFSTTHQCVFNKDVVTIIVSLFQILFIINIFNEDPSICASSSSTLPTCHGTFHTMLLAAAPGRTTVSCTVAANDFQKISWCGCSVSENWKIPQVRKDPSPLICLKVTLLIFPLTNLQEHPVAMKLGCCTYWWQISRFHFVQILCYFFTIF